MTRGDVSHFSARRSPESAKKLARYEDCKANCYCKPLTDVKCLNCKEADVLALELSHIYVGTLKQVRELRRKP